MDKMHKIAVLDFGGQYAHLIANRIRRLGVYSEILPPTTPARRMAEFKALILSGGPSSVYATNAPSFNNELLECSIPKLGICYGHQLMCQHLGGKVSSADVKEYGIAKLEKLELGHPLLDGIPSGSRVWMSHGDQVEKLPAGFRRIGSTEDCASTIVADDAQKCYGLQFHPEVTHSEDGNRLLNNFLDIAGCERSWNMESYQALIKEQILEKVGKRKVFLLVSGGVDSTVAFILLNRILGKERVFGLHIDTGTMRKDESEDVLQFLKSEDMDNLLLRDASDFFLNALKGVTEPEKKRHVIGDAFLQVKDQEIEKLQLNPKVWLLAQGTIYPDTIESGGTDNADLIKTHHNRVQAVMDLLESGDLIEPLADLYKDEVRELGKQLGIPRHLLWRHPFPGPGLGVRLLCSTGKENFSRAEDIPGLGQFLESHRIKGQVLPIKSVGVQGDGRTYAQPFVLQDKLDWERCEELGTALTNRFHELNRVVAQIGPAETCSFETVAMYCSKEALDILRKFDAICTEFLQEHSLYQKIWQMPVVLLPLQVRGKAVIVLRPVHSQEAMTASFFSIEKHLLDLLWKRLEAAGAGAVLYDVTHKPPGTIEWE